MHGQYKTVIKPKGKFLDLHIRETLQYVDLIFLLVKREFVAKYKQTILGPLWAVIQPFLTTVVFTVIFGSLANLTTMDVTTTETVVIPGFLFYMAGTICWGYFSGTVQATASTFIANSGIMGKVYFPRLVMPIATAFSNLISFAIQFVIFVVIWGIYLLFETTTMAVSWHMALLPLLILQMMMLAMGFGVIISALTTKYRDLHMLVGFGLQLWQYVSPVAYGLTLISDRGNPVLLGIYMLNPVTPVITTFRYAFFGIGYFDVVTYLTGWAITLVVFFLGLLLFNKVEKNFMDTV